MPEWARLVVAAAALRVATALTLYFAGLSPASIAIQVPLIIYVVELITFTVVGLTLIVANRNDVRAAWLGTVLILIVSPLTNPWIRPAAGAVFAQLDAVRADAFVAAALWRFDNGQPFLFVTASKFSEQYGTITCGTHSGEYPTLVPDYQPALRVKPWWFWVAVATLGALAVLAWYLLTA